MLIPTLIMGALALILLFVGYQKGGLHISGLKTAGNLFISIIPLLFFAFIVAGMVQVLLPSEVIAKWMGEESGIRGILIGTAAGGLIPGGPFVSMPIAAGLMGAGAGVGTIVAYLTGWSLLQFARIPIEVGILGWKLALIRISCTFFFPPIAGLIASFLFAGKISGKV